MSLNEEKKDFRNPLTGVVSKVSIDKKTAKVFVYRTIKNVEYGKRQNRKTVLLIDTNGVEVKDGQSVLIVPCRKKSKLKSWMIQSVS